MDLTLLDFDKKNKKNSLASIFLNNEDYVKDYFIDSHDNLDCFIIYEAIIFSLISYKIFF